MKNDQVRPQNVRKPFGFLINYHNYFRLFQGRRQDLAWGPKKVVQFAPPHTQKNTAAALLNLIFFRPFFNFKGTTGLKVSIWSMMEG